MKIFCLLILLLTACTQKQIVPPPVVETPAPAPLPIEWPVKDIPLPVVKCAMKVEKIVLQNQTVAFPEEGKMVLESHLATKEDSFGSRAFPKTVIEGMDVHLNRACAELKKYGMTDCSKVFSTKYHREWTPPESGKAGQGSVGDRKPSVPEEMWSGNMYWTSKSKPAPGTKFLAAFGDKYVVVVMGYETGPRDPKWLGGLQGEVLWWLGAKQTDKIIIGRLLDQSLPPGPVECKL